MRFLQSFTEEWDFDFGKRLHICEIIMVAQTEYTPSVPHAIQLSNLRAKAGMAVQGW